MLVPNRRSVLVVVALIAGACARKPTTEAATSEPGADTTAATSAAAADLRGTRWQLVALGDKPVAAVDTQRAAHVILQPDSKQVAGSGGCNRMFGVYELNGDALRFSGIGSTKMACQDGMDTETAFLPALLRVAKYRIDGQQLELSDSTGAVIAKFAAKAK